MLALAALPAAGLQGASAETRTLKLYYTHTREKAEVTFKRNGRYLPEGLKKANHMMRDWRRNEPTKMDPKLLDLLWEVYKEAGGRDYIHIVSGYRSPATNSMLRRTRGGQAEKSQHMVGKAVDFFIPGVKISKLRAVALRKQGGGVGYYPKSGSPFVHIDTGRVRHWPRMSRKELVAVFPNGKTLHVPSDGKPLPGYEQALAAYKANGRGDTRNAVQFDSDDEAPKSGGSRTLLAILFGGGADESEDEADSAAPARPAPVAEQAPVAVAAAPQPEPVQLEAAPRPVPPADIAAVPAETPAPEPEPQFAALPGRNAPVPSPAPRAAPIEEQLVAAAPAEPQAPAADPSALGESEIAALLASDIAPVVPEPSPVLAALAPKGDVAASGNPFDALLPAEGLAPAPRPDSAVPQVAADAPASGDEVLVALAPVPQPRPADAPVSARTTRLSTASVVPAPKAERIVKEKPALAALAPVGQGKAGRVVTAAQPAPLAVAPLPVDSSRFGPRATGGSDAGQDVDPVKTASVPAIARVKPAEPAAVSSGGNVLPDGSVLIKAGKIPLGD
jgi:uncharacterized protein YcbK (DUF882 family)